MLPRQKNSKNQSYAKLVEYQKVYLLYNGHFMNVKKIISYLHLFK